MSKKKQWWINWFNAFKKKPRPPISLPITIKWIKPSKQKVNVLVNIVKNTLLKHICHVIGRISWFYFF